MQQRFSGLAFSDNHKTAPIIPLDAYAALALGVSLEDCVNASGSATYTRPCGDQSKMVRDCLSNEVLCVQSLLSATHEDLTALRKTVRQTVEVPIVGIISDGQLSIHRAVATAFPTAPHQLCHFHYLREAAKPIYEADRHAKKELKKCVRGVRPIERQLDSRTDPEAQVIRGYCSAVRSALTDDARPPLIAAGLKLHERLTVITHSLDRLGKKGLCLSR